MLMVLQAIQKDTVSAVHKRTMTRRRFLKIPYSSTKWGSWIIKLVLDSLLHVAVHLLHNVDKWLDLTLQYLLVGSMQVNDGL